jgi:hypothetical protein
VGARHCAAGGDEFAVVAVAVVVVGGDNVHDALMYEGYVGHVMTKATRPGVAFEEQTLSTLLTCCLDAKNLKKMPTVRCVRPRCVPYAMADGWSGCNAEVVGAEELV